MAKVQALSQVVAIEKGLKAQVYKETTELYKEIQKPQLFNGFIRTYQKKDESGEDLPAERQKVQMNAEEILKTISSRLTDLIDIIATKEYANGQAMADVMLEDKVLIKDAPVSFLLPLEKQLTDIRAFVEKLPEQDEAEDWTKDGASGLYKTEPVQTHRTKKVQKGIVLYQATDKHPAQTQLVSEDILAGYWEVTKFSGSIPVPRKKALLEKIDALAKAVKYAREEANRIDAPKQEIAKKIFDYILS